MQFDNSEVLFFNAEVTFLVEVEYGFDLLMIFHLRLYGTFLSCSIHTYSLKVFWSSQNGSFVFNQIFVYGTLMGVDYKSEKKI